MMAMMSHKRKKTAKLAFLSATWLTMSLIWSTNFLLDAHFAVYHNDDETFSIFQETKSRQLTRISGTPRHQQAQEVKSATAIPALSTNYTYSHAFADMDAAATNIKPPYVPISAIIPATLDRVHTVNRLLESIAAGTRLPQEVILAISPAHISGETTLATLNLSIPKFLYVKIVGSNQKQNAAQNRNRAAEHATMPVLAFVDSDDIVGNDWIETVFDVFNSQAIDALLHKWFYCRNNVPREDRNKTWTLLEQENMMIVNELMPANLSQNEAWKWVANPRQVHVATSHNTNHQLLLWDSEFNHPWWTLGHVSVKRNVYWKVKQNEKAVGHEDALFTADLLLQEYKVATIKNQLTGYCKQ